MNLTYKILSEHLAGGELRPGEEIGIRVDQALLQDATGTMACLQFEELGLNRIRVPFAIVYVDHNVLQLDFKNPDDHLFLQDFAGKYGGHFSRPGNGICHYLHLERFARPGHTLIGADSHTTSSGSMGMIAIGAGGLDVAVAMAGYPFVLETPKVVGVELIGSLSPWVQAKDIILELLRRRGVRGGLGCIFEFYGEGVGKLTATERETICNMIAETGATTAIFPSDEQTRAWLREQQREEQFAPLHADPGAIYDEYEQIDLRTLEPLIAKPHSPGNVAPVREVAGTPVAQVCVGSSVNSSYEDLAIVGAVLRGQTVHPKLTLTVTPGSRQILDTIAASGVYRELVAAGARMLEPICGPCVGMGQAPPSGGVSVRTMNRNFPGRSGTQDDNVYLCSPATAAATALKGVITDPRDLGSMPEIKPALSNPLIDDRQILPPASLEEAAKIQILRGPNIKPPPKPQPLPERWEERILIVVGDDISTGDLAPDGADVMAFRSNVPAIAEFTFRRVDATLPRRAQEWGGGFIVAGHNYGQGSSREHAAMAPLFLGVRAVIAKSFARIHRRNLITQGILPLKFADEADYALAAQADTWELANVRSALLAGEKSLRARIKEKGREVILLTDLSPREVAILADGGLLAHLRLGGSHLSAGEVATGTAEY